jgi:hypothetical protein
MIIENIKKIVILRNKVKLKIKVNQYPLFKTDTTAL